MGKFIRFGGLSPVKQKQYKTKDKTFHNPPRRKGIYAFRDGYIEMFLLGATNDPGGVSNAVSWLYDDNGNKVVYEGEDEIEYDSEGNVTCHGFETRPVKHIRYLLKKQKIQMKYVFSRNEMKGDCEETYDTCNECEHYKKCKTQYVVYFKKPKYFDYNGEIWHHLGDHLKPHEIIGESGSWVKTTMEDYEYAFKQEIFTSRKSAIKEWGLSETYNGKMTLADPFKRSFPGINYSKDHLEVFIEKL